MNNFTRAYTAKKRPRTRGRHLIEFYSKKNRRLVWLASNLERQFALMLEFNPDVFSYATQPESFILEGKRRYTPDFLVAFKMRRPAYYEVHQEAMLDDAFWNRFNAACEFLNQRGEPELSLITDKQLKKPLVTNLDCLYSYLDVPLPTDTTLYDEVPQTLTLAELTARITKTKPFQNPIDARRIALILVANNHFKADLSTPLSHQTALIRG